VSSRSKKLGTEHETKVVDYLRAHGYPQAKRSAQKGAADEGDISLGDDVPVVVEAKAYFRSTQNPLDLTKWMRETEAEIENACAQTGFAVLKRPGVTDVGEYFAVLPVWRVIELLHQAGYRPRRRVIRRPH
jgi:hypothetical protein